MPYVVIRYETTPNPNALKCWLDRPVSEGPRSFLNAAMAADDALASALFAEAGATCVVRNGDWFTFNKAPDADWRTVKKHLERVLAETGA